MGPPTHKIMIRRRQKRRYAAHDRTEHLHVSVAVATFTRVPAQEYW